MIDINKYSPGRFTYLMKENFTQDLWDYLSSDTRISQMITAIKNNKPAIEPFLLDLESKFETCLSSKAYPDEEICILANNMIKQILELKGYEHIACGICPQAHFIKTSGMYQKKTKND